MSYNEKLADRTREIIALTHKHVEEKSMFGGLCFMVNLPAGRQAIKCVWVLSKTR